MDYAENSDEEGPETKAVFPDIANVLHIRKALWRHKAKGHASVMVGSGFSRNADPISTSTRQMPTWAQLVEALCAPLYPYDEARRKAAVYEASGTSGFLRIAEEYKIVFGASALNDFVRSLIPDTEYRPGRLHRRLLRLPWADVFTTNWDTLLERARVEVFERSYDVVRRPDDVPASSTPRIVKLHGSLSGNEPFVFTEEDYRTYPDQFSPFVNLVQQSMMETTFCLIGFSGDDPNFLHWSGWVRDNLGARAPKIYLVGWLDLSNHRRRMLEARNVMPVDLAALHCADQWPKHLRHRYASEWFISALELGKPYTPTSWPSIAESQDVPSHLGPLPVKSGPGLMDEGALSNIDGDTCDPNEAVGKLVGIWRNNRKLYPGWIVAPKLIRSYLWRDTPSRSSLFHDASRLGALEQLFGLSELVWRLEASLFPLFSSLSTSVRNALLQIDFEQCQVGSELLRQGESWEDVLDAAERLAVAISRLGRQELDSEKHQFGMGLLEKIQKHQPSAQNAAQYEHCLWDLAMGDVPAIIKRLDTWTQGDGDNLWNLRKAGLLAEVKEYGQARTLLEETLQLIRRHRRRDVDDIVSLSLEGWALYLALAFARPWNTSVAFKDDAPEPFERWDQLAAAHCDAFSEWHQILTEVQRPERLRPAVQRTRGFDIGRSRVTHSLGSGIDHRMLASYRVVMLAEITGIPPAAQHVSLFREGLVEAAKGLAASDAALAAQLAMRLDGEEDLLDQVFSRAHVARMPPFVIDKLKSAALRRVSTGSSLFASSKRIDPTVRLGSALEILSRIAVRLSSEDLLSSLGRAVELYNDESIRKSHHSPGRELKNLFDRVISSLSEQEIKPWLLRLFSLPLVVDEVPNFFANQLLDPMSELDDKFSVQKTQLIENLFEWEDVVRKLIVASSSSNAAERASSIIRLCRLYSFGVLSENQKAQFAENLWLPSRRDEFGLPANTGLREWVYLQLPEVEAGQADVTLSQYIVNGLNSERDINTRINELAGILRARHTLSRPVVIDDAEYFALRRIAIEWVTAKQRPKRELDHLLTNVPDLAEYAVFSAAIVVKHARFQPAEWEQLWKKADDMDAGRDGDRLAVPLYPLLAGAFPDRSNSLLVKLRRALLSDDEDEARQAVVGGSRWIQDLADQPAALPELHEAVRLIGLSLARRRSAALLPALDFSAWLFQRGPTQYRELIVDDCDFGLSALIEESSYERTDQPFDVPTVRASAAKLANAMAKGGYGDRLGVSSWLAAAANDPLPEVRQAAGV